MVSKEDFNKVWKDSSRENILNQFYYEHYELFRIKKEVREYIEEEKLWYDKELGLVQIKGYGTDRIPIIYIYGLLDILDKGE